MMNNSNKKTAVLTNKTENGQDIKLPKLDPTKTSIAQHQSLQSK